MVDSFSAFIPIDRGLALAQGSPLPDRTTGAALFADISGSTAIAEALANELGPQRGAEELTRQLNQVFGALTEKVHAYRGSVIGFSGDAITCWFDGDSGLHAVACGLEMQKVIGSLPPMPAAAGAAGMIAIKVAVAAGQARRFMVGNPDDRYVDVLAGKTLERLAATEHLSRPVEVLVDAETLTGLGEQVIAASWRKQVDSGHSAALVSGLTVRVEPVQWPAALLGELRPDQTRAWVPPLVLRRLENHADPFLADLRPNASLFVSFGGIDFDEDDQAGGLLDAFIRRVQQVLTRYEGSLLDLTIGDKGSYLLAVFGAAVAHDDDAARAVAAA